MTLALDHVPLHAVGVGNREEFVPRNRRRAQLAVLVATRLAEDGVELFDALAHAVLLGVERRRAVRILLVLGDCGDSGELVSRAGRPADVLLHAHVLRGVREEVVPERRAVEHLDAVLPRVVVEADLAALGLRHLGGLVVELDELLREVVDRLRGLARLAATACGPGGAGRDVAAAGADDEAVAVGELERARLLKHVGVERAGLRVEAVLVVRHMRAAHDKARVREHRLELFRRVVVVAGKLDALVAERRDVLERLRHALALHELLAGLVLLAADVRADGVELQGDLRLRAAAAVEATAAG